MTHESVLLHESIDGLELKAGDTFVDCTLGGGGHSLEVWKRFGKAVNMIGLDADQDAAERSKRRLEDAGASPTIAIANFRTLGAVLDGLGIENADKFLFDLGTSAFHYEESERGFSFQKDEPLVMTLEKNPAPDALTAHAIVNSWDEENIATILYAYGDERYSRRIAHAIAEARRAQEIKTTKELVDVIVSAVPAVYRRGKIHPATRTFQALRIAVNDEYRALEEALTAAWARLRAGGRIAVISFHSGEDRIVKNFFRDKAKSGEGTLVVKKPITPSDGEIERNPRARSGKLRIISKT